jgi:hypothetical protein
VSYVPNISKSKENQAKTRLIAPNDHFGNISVEILIQVQDITYHLSYSFYITFDVFLKAERIVFFFNYRLTCSFCWIFMVHVAEVIRYLTTLIPLYDGMEMKQGLGLVVYDHDKL